jgi:hypothetical protein
MMKMLAGAASVAALATAAPAAAQYYPGYSYGAPYGNAYGYNNSQVLAQRCTAAVQQRLSYRTGNSGGILGALFGVNTATQGRVLSVTRINPNRSTVRVRGLATSGRAMAYNPYGVGYYGSNAYAYQPDLTFKCDIDYRGVVRDIDINRR